MDEMNEDNDIVGTVMFLNLLGMLKEYSLAVGQRFSLHELLLLIAYLWLGILTFMVSK